MRTKRKIHSVRSFKLPCVMSLSLVTHDRVAVLNGAIVGLNGARASVVAGISGLNGASIGFNGVCGVESGVRHGSRGWVPPLHGSFSLFIDAAVTLGRGFVGCGGVIRDGARVIWATCAVGVVEIDSLCVCNWVRPIVEEIVSLLAAVSGGSCQAISHAANSVAHALAKSITYALRVRTWTDASPKFISVPITVDLVR
uniref:RNase H type-1 domain-containing protein n=1 Tax=Cannabis sativa TaxID=3483 RepID=A0A803Q549_CANSA